MIRSLFAFSLVFGFLGFASAKQIPLKELTNPVLQQHVAKYLESKEGKEKLAKIAPYATLRASGLNYSSGIITWEYTANQSLTNDQENETRTIAREVLIQSLGNFEGGLLSGGDYNKVIDTLRVQPDHFGSIPGPLPPAKPEKKPEIMPRAITSRDLPCCCTPMTEWSDYYCCMTYISAPTRGCFFRRCSKRTYCLVPGYSTCSSPCLITSSGYTALPPTNNFADISLPVNSKPLTTASFASVSYMLTPKIKKELASADSSTILYEVHNAYRSMNYQVAHDLVLMAIEKDSTDPILWCWRSAIEWNLGNKDLAKTSAEMSMAYRVITSVSDDTINRAIELIQGSPRINLRDANRPANRAEALAIISKPSLPTLASTFNVSK